MKKSILLFSACLVAGFAQAQSAHTSVLTEKPAPGLRNLGFSEVGAPIAQMPSAPTGSPATTLYGARTTSPGGRWYNFVDFLFQPYQQVVRSHDVNYYSYTMWNDTSVYIGYTSTTPPSPVYNHNNLVSVGLGFDPTYTSYAASGFDYGWNTTGPTAVTAFPTTAIAVTSADAYDIDSIYIAGWYTENTMGHNSVDTLIITFVEGDRSSSATNDLMATAAAPPTGTSYGVVSINYERLWHDTVNNRAAHAGGTPVTTTTYKFPLTIADTTGNSNVGFVFPRTAAETPPPAGSVNPFIHVPANHTAAATVTFKHGTNVATVPVNDTIRFTNATTVTGYKYNNFQVHGSYANISTGSTTTEFPLADPSQVFSGYWGFEGGNFPGSFARYYTNWNIFATATGGGTVAADAQYPRIAYHVYCATCRNVGDPALSVKQVTDLSRVAVAPNPANDVLNIGFNLANGETGSVTLTDMVGQVVASQTTTYGKVVFNTSALPSGIYIYNVNANGQSATGRVVVAH